MTSTLKRLVVQRYQHIQFESLKIELDRLCESIEPSSDLSQNSSVITFGSCFAANVARSLLSMGVQSKSIEIVEYINTPFANNFYLKAALGEIEFSSKSDISAPIDSNALKDILDLLQSATMVIFTVGVGYVWVRQSDKEFVVIPDIRNIQNYRTKYLPLSEQVELLKDTFRLVKKINPKAKIWVTLSPVPLEFSLNYASSVISDCVSKSILRTAIHEALVQGADFTYFPAFEFFRWLSGHFDRKFYGADGKVRHVDQDLVDIVVKKFIALNDGSLMNRETP